MDYVVFVDQVLKGDLSHMQFVIYTSRVITAKLSVHFDNKVELANQNFPTLFLEISVDYIGGSVRCY